MADKRELLAQRQAELSDTRQRLAMLMSSETASIDDIAAAQMKVATLERMIPALRSEAGRQSAKEATLKRFADGAQMDAVTRQQRLRVLLAQRLSLNATHQVAEAQRLIARVTAQDERLAAEIAALEAQT